MSVSMECIVEMESPEYAMIEYTNYLGEFGVRKILPIRVWYGSTHHHPKPQWLLDAFDLDKQAHRVFAMSDIRKWLKT